MTLRTVFRSGVERVIPTARLDEFLQAGWSEQAEVTATVRPKKVKAEVQDEPMPTVEVPDAAQQELDTNDSKGE